MTETGEHESRATIDWKGSAKDLGAALARGTGSAVVRGFMILSAALFLNLSFAVGVYVYVGSSLGRDSLAGLPLAILAFAPFVVAAWFVAQRQGVMRIVAGALDSQTPMLSKVGAHYLAGFLAGAKDRPAGELFQRGWARYVDAQGDAPWPVRMILKFVASRVPLGEWVVELAEAKTPAEQIPEAAMKRAFDTLVSERLHPSWTPVALLFLLDVAWLVVVVIAAPVAFG
jgi:hypothetical protein